VDLAKYDDAIECFACAVEIGTNPDAPGNLGLMLCRQGRQAEAIPHLLASLRARDPNPWGVYYNLGGALVRSGRVAEALPHLAEAARLAPDEPATRAGYGFALLQAGKTGPALAELREAHRLRPAGPQEMRHLAWALATHNDPQHRNPAEAVRLAEAARELTGGTNPVVLDTLAAAYADAGRMEDAVRVGLQAEELAMKSGMPPLAREARRRVDEFYRAGRPFREGGMSVTPGPPRPQGEASIREP
jgi:tetratricopeptide (TPR) repeat protein